jgi:ribosomal protein S18 acetylase RimI-like enzyme
MRLLPPQVGLANPDEATPQSGKALEPQFQRQGYGKPLMLRALGAAAAAGYQQVALTAHPENWARFMYQQCGCEFVALRRSYHLMVAKLA